VVGVPEHGEDKASFTHVADAINVGVDLLGIGVERTIVHAAADPVVVRVVGAVGGARVAGVADQIAIGVRLVGVGRRRAVVARIADTIAVSVGMRRTGRRSFGRGE
jgi:hypothetical protein